MWSWKKKHITEKQHKLIMTLNTYSIQYFLTCQQLLSLLRYSPVFYVTYSSLHSSWECHSMYSRSMNSQIPFWYSSLKSISKLSSHTHTGLLNELHPSHFPSKICSRLPLLPCMPHLLLISQMFIDTPAYEKQSYVSASPLCFPFKLENEKLI